MSVAGLGLWSRSNLDEQIRERAEYYERYQNNPEVAQIVAAINNFDPTKDTFAQWIMAGFSAVAAGASIWALLYLRRTFHETKRTADAAIAAYEADHRTWVKVTAEPVVAEVSDGGGITPTVRIKAENIGNYPAIGVRIFCHFYQGTFFPLNEETMDACITKELESYAELGLGRALLPEEWITSETTGVILRDAIADRFAENMLDHSDKARNITRRSVLFGALYRSAGSDTVRGSIHVAILSLKGGGNIISDTSGDDLRLTVLGERSVLS